MSFPVHRWLGWLLVGAIAITFGRLIFAEFVSWDDPLTVAANPRMLPPTAGAVAGYWRLFPTPAAGEMRVINHESGLWIPLTYTIWSGLAALAQVGDGVQAPRELNPWVFHAANVAIHAGTSLLVLRLLGTLGLAPLPALIGAMVFALHPLQVEAVAWVSGLKDLLAGLFSIGCILLFLMQAAGSLPRALARMSWWLALVLMVAAMLCKPSAVATPLILLVMDRLLLRRPTGLTTLATLPFFAAAVPFAVIARLSQSADLWAPPLWQRPLIAADALAFYAAKLIWPSCLSVDHGRSPGMILQTGEIYWTWIVPVLIGMAAVWVWRAGERRPLVGL
ncbi:MAG: hypothetical protein NZ561_12750, partial [Phycisphaerae bacterium]|nr:hypothetical protein [Phycisphaerae bacterium]